MNDNDLKYYYSIGEVSEKYGLKESTLRFWEKEFKELNPFRSSRGIRKYTKDDLIIIEKIISLTKENGHTLKAAKRKIKQKNKSNLEKAISELEKMKEKLKGLLDSLSNKK